jgi:hypothetical protein
MSDAYQDGQDAFQQGVNIDANPYQGQAGKEESWADGWEDAKLEADLKRRSICADPEVGPSG